MSFLGDLVIRLKAETADFTSDMGKAARDVERGIKNIESAARTVQSTVASVVGALGIKEFKQEIVDATVEAERAQVRQQALLDATGHSALMAKRDLDEMAESMSKSTTFDDTSIRNAQTELIKFGNITAPVFERATQASADLASAMGGNIPEAAQIVGRALQSPTEGVRGLQAVIGKLDNATLRHIETLVMQKNALGAQDAILKIIETRIGGVAEAMNTGLIKATRDVSKEWNGLLEDMGKSDAIGGRMVNFFGALADTLRDIRLVVQGRGHESSLGKLLADMKATGTAELLFGKQPEDLRGNPLPPELGPQAIKDAIAANNAFWANYGKKPTLGGREGMSAQQELKLFTSSLQSLEKAYFNLDHQGQVAITRYETEKGSLKDLIKPHKDVLDAKAAEIDAYKRDLDMRKLVIDGIIAENAARSKAIQLVKDATEANRQERGDLSFQSSLVGKSAREQEILQAQRQIELRARQQAEQLPMDEEGNLLTGGVEALAKIRQQADEQKRIVRDMIADRQEAERSWIVGAKQGFDDFAETAANAAQMTRDLYRDVFQGLENAIVSFVMTGKANFKDFANAIIADIVRIQVRQSIVKPLAGLLDEGIKGLGSIIFGGGRAIGGPVLAGHAYTVGENGPETLVMGTNSGTVVPNGGGRGVSIVQHIHVDSRSDLASVHAAMRTAKDAAVAEVYDRMSRGDRP